MTKKAVVDRLVYRMYLSDEKDCDVCQLKRECIRRKYANRINLCAPAGSVPGNLTKPLAKIDSDKGRKIYSPRLIIVEPVFANIRTHNVMNQFTLRGMTKVNIQWLLYCMSQYKQGFGLWLCIRPKEHKKGACRSPKKRGIQVYLKKFGSSLKWLFQQILQKY
jgi:Transposase DDE domain